MKIAVFGAAGWTGRAVLANLRGVHEVLSYDLNEDVWQAWQDVDGEWRGDELIHGSIVDFSSVHQATDGVQAVIHLARHGAPGGYGVDDEQAFLVNLKGLWNVLESVRQRNIRRVVHIGSCQTVHPKGVFFGADVRRPDGSLYAVCKRLQEEMCRQFHDAYGMSIAVLRPDYIVDSRIGMGRHREKLGPDGTRTRNGWVCRHDLAEACRLAAASETLDFEVLHIVGTPEAEQTCNVARSREVLGLE